jgi:hypothetical protein
MRPHVLNSIQGDIEKKAIAGGLLGVTVVVEELSSPADYPWTMRTSRTIGMVSVEIWTTGSQGEMRLLAFDDWRELQDKLFSAIREHEQTYREDHPIVYGWYIAYLQLQKIYGSTRA